MNDAFSDAIKLYLDSSRNKDGIIYNSFEVVTIRILALIYGKLDIINPYYLGNSVAFMNNLSKYGMSKADIALFKDEFLNFYFFEKENRNRKIKLKNPYFKTTLKFLVEMFVAKKKFLEVSLTEEEKFLELAYTTHTKNLYRISYGYLMNDDSLYIEKYYYSKLNEMDVTREIDLNKTISTNLNLEALNYIGVNLSNLQSMSGEEIERAKNDAYNYFEIDASNPNRDLELQNSIDYYKMFGRKVTTGNGYVDILLLLSVIVTSFSVFAVIIFSM